MEAQDAIPYNAAILVRKGVLVSLNSDDAELMRHLDKEAAKTMKYGGLTETEALSLVTINPAKQLMIDKRVVRSKWARMRMSCSMTAHPLSNFSKVEKVWIDGHEYFDRDQDMEARPKKEIEKKALMIKRCPQPAWPRRSARPAGGPTSVKSDSVTDCAGRCSVAAARRGRFLCHPRRHGAHHGGRGNSERLRARPQRQDHRRRQEPRRPERHQGHRRQRACRFIPA